MRLTLILLLFSSTLLAQQIPADTSRLWLVRTTDSNEYVGEIIEQNSQGIQLRTPNIGTITIQSEDIESIEPINSESIQLRQEWRRHPHATRYFFAPNGYNLRQGEGYYQNTWVLFNQASVGITDRISIGAGMIPLFLFAGTPTPVWVTPKISFPVRKDQVNLGVGGLIGTVIADDPVTYGMAYGVGTFGSRNKNLTVGLGYAFAEDEWSSIPLITVSGTTPLGKRSFLITENYFVSSEGTTVALISVGGRSLAKTISFDYGLFIPIVGEGTFIAIPWLSLTVPFGK